MPSLTARKILLVHPLGYHAEAAKRDISRKANIMPPLGLASIAAYLEDKGYSASIIDCYARPDSDRLIKKCLIEERPSVIGFSCTTSSFLDGIRISTLAKSVCADIRVVFGGHHVSALRERALQDFSIIDFAVVGEGEETLSELLESGGENASSIQGLVYRQGNDGIRFNGYRRSSLDLDTLPFPAYEKLEGYPKNYALPIFNYPKTPNTSCVSSRGCPYSCSYCDRSVFLRSFRCNSAEYMYEHLRYLKERFHIKHINFYDDQFTLNRERIEKFTRMMIDHRLGMSFNCAARAEHIDLDILQWLKAAGCWMISIGIESGDPNLLSQHRQNADLDLIAEKIRLIKQAKIRTKGLFMMGLPGETEESIKKSMNYLFSLPIDDFNLTKFTPFPGSPIYEEIREQGEFDEDWKKMDCMHFLYIPEGMTKDRMEKLYKEFYKAHFMRLNVLWGYITMIWHSPNSWIRFFQNLVYFVQFARSNKRLGSEDA